MNAIEKLQEKIIDLKEERIRGLEKRIVTQTTTIQTLLLTLDNFIKDYEQPETAVMHTRLEEIKGIVDLYKQMYKED